VGAFSLSRRLVAEALGTGLLVATVVGSGSMAETLADGNVALALLGNTVATGAILVVLILVFGPISGAHLNPAVTTAFMIAGDIERREAALYIVVQIAGGIAGTMLAHAMFDLPLFSETAALRTGPSQWLSEFVATFGLLAAILGCLAARPESVSYAGGLYITAGYWFTASTSFANPAVTIARALTDTFSGIRPIDAPAFIVAQLAGAVAALVVFRWLLAAPGPAADAAAAAQKSRS
jgi:glycerol uptake facilitator-like aquaporin